MYLPAGQIKKFTLCPFVIREKSFGEKKAQAQSLHRAGVKVAAVFLLPAPTPGTVPSKQTAG